MRPHFIVPLALMAATATVAQDTYELAVDVPSILSGTRFGTHQVVRRTGSGYSTTVSLPPSVGIGALHRRPDGVVLFAPTRPIALGGIAFDPRDVIAYDGLGYSLVFDGAAAGVPSGSRVDALFTDSDNALVLSFDVPVRLAGTWHGRSNLLRYNGSWTDVWDATAAGVPASANLVGADRSPSGEVVVTFDIPVRLGETLYKPGDLIGWNGASFELIAADATWPPGTQLRDFTFLPAAGAVPESSDPSATLLVDKTPGAEVALSWGPSCRASDTDYGVYEGSIEAGFSSHAPVLCSTVGAFSTTLLPNEGNRYFLVVPRNAVAEGSYGTASNGSERAPANNACLPTSVARCGTQERLVGQPRLAATSGFQIAP